MSERRALLLSPVACLVIAATAGGFFLVSHSQAILLDGAFNLLYFVLGLVTLRIQRLVAEPPSHTFPFGHAAFEPLLNTIKGLLVLAVSAMALLPAVHALFTGGRHIEPGLGALYGLLAMVVATALAITQRRVERRTGSPLLRADAENWRANALVSAAVAAAFLGVALAERLHIEWLVPYVDPVVVTVVVLASAPIPFRLLREGVAELLLVGPSRQEQDEIVGLVQGVLPDDVSLELDVRVARVGRKEFISVCCLVDGSEGTVTIPELDQVRDDVRGALKQRDPGVILDVTFTASSRWVRERISELGAALPA